MSDALPRVRGRLARDRALIVHRWKLQLAAAAAAGFTLDAGTLALLPAVLEALDANLARRFRPPEPGAQGAVLAAHRAGQRAALLHDYLCDVAAEGEPLSPHASRAVAGAVAQALAQSLVREAAAAVHAPASLVAHDLRNAATAARLSLDLLRRSAGLPETPAARALERTVSRLGELVEDAQLDALLLPGALEPRSVDAVALLRGAVRESGGGIDDRKGDGAIDAPRSLRVRADPRAAELVLASLLRTARGLDGGGPVRGSVSRIGLMGRLALSVGAGRQPPPRLSALPQVRRAKRLVALQGGQLRTHRDGRGRTTFAVDFPLNQPAVKIGRP